MRKRFSYEPESFTSILKAGAERLFCSGFSFDEIEKEPGKMISFSPGSSHYPNMFSIASMIVPGTPNRATTMPCMVVRVIWVMPTVLSSQKRRPPRIIFPIIFFTNLAKRKTAISITRILVILYPPNAPNDSSNLDFLSVQYSSCQGHAVGESDGAAGWNASADTGDFYACRFDEAG